MKKILICVLALGLVFLTGCEAPKLENGEDAVVSLDKDLGISVSELYDALKEKYGAAVLIDMIDTAILDKEYKTTQDMTDYITDQITYIKEQTGDSFESTINQYWGVETEKELEPVLLLQYKRDLYYIDYAKEKLESKEVKEYYDNEVVGDIRASHILIPIETTDTMTDEELEEADKKAKEKCEKIIKELDEGKSFADLAKKNSSDGSASEGGDLDFFNKGDMVTEFEEAAYALKKNEYTKTPVKTTYGYHIIKKTDERAKEKFENVEEDIKETLAENMLNEEGTTITVDALKALRKKYNMKINDSSIKKAYDKQLKEALESATTTTE